jgi:hypothetical protein
VNNTEVWSISSFSLFDLGRVAGLSRSEACDSREVGCELEELEVPWGCCGNLKLTVLSGRFGVKYRELGGELPGDSFRVSKEPSDEFTRVSQKGNSLSEGYGDACED